MRSSPRLLVPALAALALLSLARTSRAADCSTLPNAVYVTGSSAFKPILGALAGVLAGATPPVTIIYKGQGSCSGVDAILNGTPLTGTGAAVSYWDSASMEQHCDLAAPGAAADVGLSDVFTDTCFPGTPLPGTVGDFPGPVQTMTFVAPNNSLQKSISAEAAYFALGFGAGSGVAPWTDPSNFCVRNALSGTQQMIATALKVPAAQWFGTQCATSGAVLTCLSSSTNADATLGILATDVADDNRSTLKILPYQHYDQNCGYWPDSDADSTNKQNVRDGHYQIWGPLHILTQVSISTGDPVKASTKAVISYLTGTQQAPAGLDLIKLEYTHHVVPQCAMHVQRSEEMGALQSFQPTRSCGCYYDKLAGSTSCTSCQAKSDCPAAAPACNFGFCEVQ